MPTNKPWSECPAGELAELQRSLQEQSRRVHGRRNFMIATGSVTLGIASAGIGIVLSRREPGISILSCQETIDLLPRFVDGTLTNVSMRKAIEVHLDHCVRCREHFEATY
ncbi:zf-HC2 domain-containing protein [Bremerella alba]|uniref:Putative zinc-finger domain-containing protein n=1 Tax=Bremerella alba TaxID=980252 RepID=A0A7V8V3Q1_9BACT|nr:zf-HC2 domain-containing protein [Bremerella alba]MBA2114379.1 hypothetical protein [Bremerella alba]